MNVHVVGRPDPVTVEMIDVGVRGARCRPAGGDAHEPPDARHASRTVSLDEQAALSIESANDAFHGFLISLAH